MTKSHSVSRGLPNSPHHSLTYSPTKSIIHAFTRSLTHSPTYPTTHCLHLADLSGSKGERCVGKNVDTAEEDAAALDGAGANLMRRRRERQMAEPTEQLENDAAGFPRYLRRCTSGSV